MKRIQILLFAVVAWALVVVPGKAPAFPLLLRSLSGKLITTDHYGLVPATTTTNYTVKTFNTKSVMLLITNTVKSIAPSVVLPQKVTLAVEPYTRDVFLTNSDGFYFSLSASNLADFAFFQIATRFNDSSVGTVETDVVNAALDIRLIHDPDFKYYQFDMVGSGNLTVVINRKGVATMTLTLKGDAGAGVDQDSDPGICRSEYVLKGSDMPQADGLPYSVYWWNHLSP